MIDIEEVLRDALIDMVGASSTKDLEGMKKVIHDVGGDPEDIRIAIKGIDALLAYNSFYE